ncbi:DUF3309 family protein [Methylocapsa acidiphila]|uniref:DUF3309 family protein n=1 Tax=Methylocapsa acidiphila TaxID=133552 RepID=UPI000427BD45|nr:DUF3309 family protein [Methylocapsa acidiphila]
MAFTFIFLILVGTALVASLPRWSFSRDWGYGPSIGFGLVFGLALLIAVTNALNGIGDAQH